MQFYATFESTRTQSQAIIKYKISLFSLKEASPHQPNNHIKSKPLHNPRNPLPPSSSIQYINLKRKKQMFNSFLMQTVQHPIFIYTYYPISSYANPFSCTQYALTSTQLQNMGNTQKILENNGVNAQEIREKSEAKKTTSAITQSSSGTHKRRNYRTKSKLIQSAKKNGQSNIINHILSFLTKHKQSQAILHKAILKLQKPQNSIEQIKQVFYSFLNFINLKRERKYINRKTILCLFRPSDLQRQVPECSQRLKQLNIEVEQLCYLYRVCVFYYIRNQSHVAILTSKRIENVAKKIHLKRRTFILQEIAAE